MCPAICCADFLSSTSSPSLVKIEMCNFHRAGLALLLMLLCEASGPFMYYRETAEKLSVCSAITAYVGSKKGKGFLTHANTRGYSLMSSRTLLLMNNCSSLLLAKKAAEPWLCTRPLWPPYFAAISFARGSHAAQAVDLHMCHCKGLNFITPSPVHSNTILFAKGLLC